MTKHPGAFAVLCFLLLVAVVQASYYYTVLPPTVASSFGWDGRPGDRMSKTPFVLTHLATVAGIDAFTWVMIVILPRMPTSTVNLPNKDYWLAPERRAATYSTIAGFLLWMINATVILLAAIFELVYRANLGHPEAMRTWPIVLLAIYLAFTVFWTVSLLCRFRKPPTPLRKSIFCPRGRSAT